MGNIADSDGMESSARGFADADTEGSTLHNSDANVSSSSSSTADSDTEPPSLSGSIIHPRKSSNSTAYQRRYERSLEHEIFDPRDQLRKRTIIPHGIDLPELALGDVPPICPLRPQAAHVREARMIIRADEISSALSPCSSPKENEAREAGLYIADIKDYDYPSGEDPEPFIPDPTKLCSHPDCPVTRFKGVPHFEGPYYHDKSGPNTRREVRIFGASNPPGFIWRSYDTCFVQGQSSVVSMKELDNVIPFAFLHNFADDDVVARFELGVMNGTARALRRKLKITYINRPEKHEKDKKKDDGSLIVDEAN